MFLQLLAEMTVVEHQMPGRDLQVPILAVRLNCFMVFGDDCCCMKLSKPSQTSENKPEQNSDELRMQRNVLIAKTVSEMVTMN